MSIKVAIASSDRLNIDLHFGQARDFFIYEFHKDHFDFLESRKTVFTEQSVENAESDFGGACCGGGGGCGASGGGCGGGAGTGPLSPNVELLLDCRAIVASQIGQKVRRQFERNAISVFDIELPIEEALAKLASYYAKFGE
ncbi:MAG: hypothetical protein J6J00_10780 [Treponema sp.]|nr:hypothetical protein [Treponema sp.]